MIDNVCRLYAILYHEHYTYDSILHKKSLETHRVLVVKIKKTNFKIEKHYYY